MRLTINIPDADAAPAILAMAAREVAIADYRADEAWRVLDREET